MLLTFLLLQPLVLGQRSRSKPAAKSPYTDFVEHARQRGLYTASLPPEVWRALFDTGSRGMGANFTVNTQVYLAGNGGWMVCGYPSGWPGRRGCVNKNLPKPTWASEIPSDANIQIDASDPEDAPRELLKQLAAYRQRQFPIELVRVGYNGEWFVMVGGIKRGFGTPDGQEWAWGNVPDAANTAFLKFVEQYRGNYYGLAPIRDVVFAPNGGFVILTDIRNGYLADQIAPEASRVLSQLRAANEPINKITFGPNGSWIILANASY